MAAKASAEGDAIGPVAWHGPDGAPVSCREKLKVLAENLEELRQMAQDAFEDAVLMGCDERQFRDVLKAMADALENPYRK